MIFRINKMTNVPSDDDVMIVENDPIVAGFFGNYEEYFRPR